MTQFKNRKETAMDDAPDKFTDVHPTHKPDMPGDNAGTKHLWTTVDSHDGTMAQHGYNWATHNSGLPIPFNPSNGMHAVGGDVVAEFSTAVNYAGGVRQGHTFVSEKASGVGRASVEGFNTPSELGAQDDGVGHTFRERQASRRAGNGG